MSEIVTTNNLSRTFHTFDKEPGLMGSIKALYARKRKEVKAVKKVSFEINEGEMIGFLGPNGAGKTTVIKMLTGILYPTGGECSVLGFNPWERNPQMQKQFGVVLGQKNQLWWDLPAYDSFLLLKEIYQISKADFTKRLDELAELLDVKNLLKVQLRNLSLGERMKMELIGAILHRPKLLFLDEPTLGLDVVSQERIRNFLKELNKQENVTILLTSHYMNDIEALAKRVIIIDHGEIIHDDTLQNIVAQYSNEKTVRLTFGESLQKSEIEPFGKVKEFDGGSAEIVLNKKKLSEQLIEILRKLPISDISILEIEAEEVIREIFKGKGKS